MIKYTVKYYPLLHSPTVSDTKVHRQRKSKKNMWDQKKRKANQEERENKQGQLTLINLSLYCMSQHKRGEESTEQVHRRASSHLSKSQIQTQIHCSGQCEELRVKDVDTTVSVTNRLNIKSNTHQCDISFNTEAWVNLLYKRANVVSNCTFTVILWRISFWKHKCWSFATSQEKLEQTYSPNTD